MAFGTASAFIPRRICPSRSEKVIISKNSIFKISGGGGGGSCYFLNRKLNMLDKDSWIPIELPCFKPAWRRDRSSERMPELGMYNDNLRFDF